MTLGAALTAVGIVLAFALPLAAEFTHLVWCFQHGRWTQVMNGNEFGLGAVVHGFGLWFGWFHWA